MLVVSIRLTAVGHQRPPPRGRVVQLARHEPVFRLWPRESKLILLCRLLSKRTLPSPTSSHPLPPYNSRHNIFLVIAPCNWQKRGVSGSGVYSQQPARARWGKQVGEYLDVEKEYTSKICPKQLEFGSHKATSDGRTTTFQCFSRAFWGKTQLGCFCGSVAYRGGFPTSSQSALSCTPKREDLRSRLSLTSSLSPTGLLIFPRCVAWSTKVRGIKG